MSILLKESSPAARVLRYCRLSAAALASGLILTTAACSTAVGTDLPERVDVLKMLRDQGFLFNKHVISTAYGTSHDQILVTGQLARTEPNEDHVKDGLKVSQVQRVVVEKRDGVWQVVEAPVLVRDQLTSRERW